MSSVIFHPVDSYKAHAQFQLKVPGWNPHLTSKTSGHITRYPLPMYFRGVSVGEWCCAAVNGILVAALSVPSVAMYFATLELMKVYYPGQEGAKKVTSFLQRLTLIGNCLWNCSTIHIELHSNASRCNQAKNASATFTRRRHEESLLGMLECSKRHHEKWRSYKRIVQGTKTVILVICNRVGLLNSRCGLFMEVYTLLPLERRKRKPEG